MTCITQLCFLGILLIIIIERMRSNLTNKRIDDAWSRINFLEKRITDLVAELRQKDSL